MSQAEAEEILDTYKRMSNECSMIMKKISELNIERDEHRLAMDTLQGLESERKAFRLVNFQISFFELILILIMVL